MGDDDWYRGPEWDQETRRVFEEKLGRARSGRSQYLRIKGLGLTGSDDPEVRRAGRELLHRVVEEHPDDELQVAWAQKDLADSLVVEGRFDEAVTHYERALSPDRRIEQYAELGLVTAILGADLASRYDEALDLLMKSGASRDPFPANRFQWNLLAARVQARRGEMEDAAELALLALRALDQKSSPFPRHRELGLAHADEETLEELRSLAGKPNSGSE